MKKPEYFSLRNRLCIGFSALLLSLFLFSCAQDPIFHNISLEEAPRDSIIGGSGGNMIFVPGTNSTNGANGDRIFAWTHRGRDVWVFDSSGTWHRIARPGGPVVGLAAVKDSTATPTYRVFAMVHTSGSPPGSQVRELIGTNWVTVSEVPDHVVLSFYSAGGRLFAGAQRRGALANYYILRFNPLAPASNPGDPLVPMEIVSTGNIDSVLAGVVDGPTGIVLATGRNGIFMLGNSDDPIDLTQPTIYPGDIVVISGMYSLPGGDIVVVGRTSDRGIARVIRNGAFLSFGPTLREDEFFTGGMGVWKQPNGTAWEPSLLLLGIWSLRRNVNGYREIALDSYGNVNLVSSLAIPGGHATTTPSSMVNRAVYTAGIGTRAVQAIMQVPPEMLLNGSTPPSGWQPPIFASTSRDGLWVYNPGTDRWNAEDNRRSWLPNLPEPCPCTCAPNNYDPCTCYVSCPCAPGTPPPCPYGCDPNNCDPYNCNGPSCPCYTGTVPPPCDGSNGSCLDP